ncbi:hypothetical protein V5P93_001970 [Actinokineospora auranticolor]|uniref:Uncharacterized protein n=1 Tax=Actinokineospora auranticolor TaxID=155976 RepID=A0A2S6GEG3_9PSEU|nr:hypothetical protein [Actinokineospora auranticolor]PPK63614.1 hypothetical protein CLV40_12621 [Actinokineospora auranticolor]
MVRQVWAAMRPAGAAQWLLWCCGTLLLASAGFHGVVALVDGGPWVGPVTWRKPVVFAVSFGAFCWSAVWVLRHLPKRVWRGALAGLLGLSSVLEVGVITTQRWRGVPSHFNAATEFDDNMFSVMGMTVVLIVLGMVLLAVWTAVDFRGPGHARIAALVGLGGLLVAGYIGSDLIAEGDAVVAATGHVPYDLTFGADGAAKFAHAAGIHGIQVLGVLAILLDGSAVAARKRTGVVAVAAIGYTAAFTSITLTAYAGRAWTDPVLPLAVLGVAGVALIGYAYLRALPRAEPGERAGRGPVRSGEVVG